MIIRITVSESVDIYSIGTTDASENIICLSSLNARTTAQSDRLRAASIYLMISQKIVCTLSVTAQGIHSELSDPIRYFQRENVARLSSRVHDARIAKP